MNFTLVEHEINVNDYHCKIVSVNTDKTGYIDTGCYRNTNTIFGILLEQCIKRGKELGYTELLIDKPGSNNDWAYNIGFTDFNNYLRYEL